MHRSPSNASAVAVAAEGRVDPALRGLLGELADRVRLARRIAAAAVALLATAVAATTIAGAVVGEWRVLPILSGSMEPAFAAGDAVLARRAPVSSVRVGDVIVFNIPIGDRHLVAHRVVAVVRRGANPVVRTKGDANPARDGWVARLDGDSLWRVEASVPLLGNVLVGANRPAARAAGVWILVAAALALALSAVWGPRSVDAHAGDRDSVAAR